MAYSPVIPFKVAVDGTVVRHRRCNRGPAPQSGRHPRRPAAAADDLGRCLDGRHRTAPAPILVTVLALLRIARHTTAEWSRSVYLTIRSQLGTGRHTMRRNAGQKCPPHASAIGKVTLRIPLPLAVNERDGHAGGAQVSCDRRRRTWSRAPVIGRPLSRKGTGTGKGSLSRGRCRACPQMAST